MKITDLNREGGIGSNSMFVELGPFRILIDAGLHPKLTGKEAMPDFSLVEDGSLDFVFLTHCHLDHLGSLPVVLRRHPEAMVFMSAASQTLAPRMLRNSCNVMKKQRAEFNIPEYPLYTFDEVDQLAQRFLPMGLKQAKVFEKEGESIEFTLYPAGHVAGAVALKIKYKNRSIFFTGDVLFKDQRILPGASFPEENFDTVVLETTRGLTHRPEDLTRESEVKRLIQMINHTLARGGSCLIPVFALGRMQEILTLINDAMENRELPYSPLYCTGLGMDLIDYFDTISRKTGQVNFSRKIMKKMQAKTLRHKLNPGENLTKKGIYVLSSGMLVSHTPSNLVAASLLDYKENSICFVGYCDPDTAGGQLLATEQGDKFYFEKLEYTATVNAQVEQFDMSGHADRDELLDYAIQSNPRAVVLTHGDPDARAWFEDAIIEEDPKIKVVDPVPGKTYEV